jgi:hypothetical protein
MSTDDEPNILIREETQRRARGHDGWTLKHGGVAGGCTNMKIYA